MRLSLSRAAMMLSWQSLAGDDRPLHEDFAHLAGRRLLESHLQLDGWPQSPCRLFWQSIRFLESVCKQHIHSFILNLTKNYVNELIQTELDGCIVWNAHNTVFGSRRSAICALAVYFVHATRPKIQGLVSRDSIVDRQFVTAWVKEWVTNISFCAVRCRQPSSDVAENLGEGFLYGLWELLWIDSNGKIETRLPVEGSFANKFPSIHNHCGVMASGSRKIAKKNHFWRIWQNASPNGEFFKILFRYDLSRHRSTCCVRISWNLVDGKSVKSCVAYLTKKKQKFAQLAHRATAPIEPKMCQGQPTRMHSECSRFHQNRLILAELYPNAWTPSERAVKCIQYSAEA